MQGRYLPVFASEIVDQNAIAEAEGRATINLTSVLIGNGITDISTYVNDFKKALSADRSLCLTGCTQGGLRWNAGPPLSMYLWEPYQLVYG